MPSSNPSADRRPTSGTRPTESNVEGIVRTRSIYAATRSSLSPSARPSDDDAQKGNARVPLLERLPSAAQALRYEAILDAFGFMGKDVIIREFDDYAAAGLPVIFACVRPLESGDLDVALALPESEDDMLVACPGEFPSATIQSKFLLEQSKPIGGRQMQLIRLASRAVTGV